MPQKRGVKRGPAGVEGVVGQPLPPFAAPPPLGSDKAFAAAFGGPSLLYRVLLARDVHTPMFLGRTMPWRRKHSQLPLRARLDRAMARRAAAEKRALPPTPVASVVMTGVSATMLPDVLQPNGHAFDSYRGSYCAGHEEVPAGGRLPRLPHSVAVVACVPLPGCKQVRAVAHACVAVLGDGAAAVGDVYLNVPLLEGAAWRRSIVVLAVCFPKEVGELRVALGKGFTLGGRAPSPRTPALLGHDELLAPHTPEGLAQLFSMAGGAGRCVAWSAESVPIPAGGACISGLCAQLDVAVGRSWCRVTLPYGVRRHRVKAPPPHRAEADVQQLIGPPRWPPHPPVLYIFRSGRCHRSQELPGYTCVWCRHQAESAEGLMAHLLASHHRLVHIPEEVDNGLGSPRLVVHVQLMPPVVPSPVMVRVTGAEGVPPPTRSNRIVAFINEPGIPYVRQVHFWGTEQVFMRRLVTPGEDRVVERRKRHASLSRRLQRYGEMGAVVLEGGHVVATVKPVKEKPAPHPITTPHSLFHTLPAVPRVDLDHDSDAELEDDWRTELSRQALMEYEDVSVEELSFMGWWNHHMKGRAALECSVPLLCEAFARSFGAKVSRTDLLIHLINLCDHGLLDSSGLLSCMAVYDASTVTDE